MEKITIVSLILTIIMFIVTSFVIHLVHKNNYNEFIIIIPIILFLIPHITLAYSISIETDKAAAAAYGIVGSAAWLFVGGVLYRIL